MCKLGAGFYMLFVTCISLSCKKLISNIICKIHVFNLYKQNVLILQSGTIKLFGKKKKKKKFPLQHQTSFLKQTNSFRKL